MSTPAGPTGPTTPPSPPSTPPPKSSPAFNKDVTFLYFWYRLDCLGDIGHALALDFVARPQAWKGAKNVARSLADLRAKWGTEPDLPSTEQRAAVFGALFGADFATASQQFMAAASAFAERNFDSGLGALRESFRSAAADFRAHLRSLGGASTETSKADLQKFTDAIYRILRDDNVAGIFGFTKPSANYPYEVDANGNELVAEISRRVGSHAYTAAEVMNLQRLALAGAAAIDATLALDPNTASDADLDKLASQAYRWQVAARMLSSQPAAGARTAAAPVALASYR